MLVLTLMPVMGVADIHGTIQVIDGDTIDVGEVRIRLHAIDAPEIDQSCETEHGLPFACGVWAAAQVRDRFHGRWALCKRRGTDRHRRVVATCRVDGVDMGAEIVRAGVAFAYRRYGPDYDLDEKAAYVAHRGLHAFRVQAPAQVRRARATDHVPPRPACRIKGNISANGYIFHVPGQAFYERTAINEARGERWFCSEAEAVEAGWRPARR